MLAESKSNDSAGNTVAVSNNSNVSVNSKSDRTFEYKSRYYNLNRGVLV